MNDRLIAPTSAARLVARVTAASSHPGVKCLWRGVSGCGERDGVAEVRELLGESACEPFGVDALAVVVGAELPVGLAFPP